MYRPYIERARELWLRRGRGVRLQGLETHAPWQTHHAPEVLHLALCVTGSDPVTQTGGGEGRSFVISTGGAEGPGVEKSLTLPGAESQDRDFSTSALRASARHSYWNVRARSLDSAHSVRFARDDRGADAFVALRMTGGGLLRSLRSG